MGSLLLVLGSDEPTTLVAQLRVSFVVNLNRPFPDSSVSTTDYGSRGFYNASSNAGLVNRTAQQLAE